MVVDSLTSVLSGFLAKHPFEDVVLVGYSGGGTLAVLLAARLPAVAAVVTIAGNLDIDRWTALHAYRPLTSSVNPASQPPLPAALQQIHMVGSRDTNVPPDAMLAYLGRLSPDQVWIFADFDHTCCWLKEWPRILPRLESALRR